MTGDLAALRKRLGRAKADRDHALRQLKAERAAVAAAADRLADAQEAAQVARDVAQWVQRQAHARVAGVVSRCLKTVFGDEYDFRIDFEQKRGKTEARLVLLKGDLEIKEDIPDSDSGGVVDVAAFALRLACLLLSRPRRRKFLCLDEPFKHLSKKYRPAVRALLLTLAEELGVQFLVSTHAPELAIGKVVEL